MNASNVNMKLQQQEQRRLLCPVVKTGYSLIFYYKVYSVTESSMARLVTLLQLQYLFLLGTKKLNSSIIVVTLNLGLESTCFF